MNRHPLVDAAQARAADVAAVDRGATWAGLMDRAAAGLARGVVRLAGRGYGLRVAILAGHGNNGGDGWAAASHLRALGAMPWVVAVTGLDAEMSDEAAAFRRTWLTAGGRHSDGLNELEAALDWSDVAVDAMLGTGAKGDPRGAIADACRALAAHDTPVVACDMPTGVDADTGEASNPAVTVAATVTFGALKRGLLLQPGRRHAGHVTTVSLGFEWSCSSDWAALSAREAAPETLPASADKRTRGVALIVAGSIGTGGAAALCASGAVRAGAGLVTVATPASVRAEVASHDPAVMTLGLDEVDGELSGNTHLLAGQVERSDVVVAGPGLGTGDGVAKAVAALRGMAGRLVLDADALNVHRDDPLSLAEHVGPLVLTPHDRELARIHPDGEGALADRSISIPALAARLDATIVAKGPSTMIAAPDGRVWLTPTGGPSLGSGGTGDVLAGVIGAAIARAEDIPLAAARAAWWHGLAGDLAARRTGERGTAAAVLEAIPSALQRAIELAEDDPDFPFGDVRW